MMEGRVGHSNGGEGNGSLLNVAIAGCFVTGAVDDGGGGGGGTGRRTGLCALDGWIGGGLGGVVLNGVSTYSLLLRSASGLGVASETGGGGRKGANGAVTGAGTLMIGARGRCVRGRD